MALIFIISFLLSALAFSYEEYSEWMHEFGHSKWDFREKIASVFHRTSLLCVGYTYPYGWIELPFFLIVYWTLTGIFQNILKDRDYFAISDETANPIEKWSTWQVKLTLFLLSIILIILY